jgi:hypothetical protein
VISSLDSALTIGSFVAFVCEPRSITTRIIVLSSPEFVWGVRQRWRPTKSGWAISLSNSPLALKLSFVFYLRSFNSMLWHRPSKHNRTTLGFWPPLGHSSTKGQCYDSRGSYHSGRPISLEDRSMQGLGATKSSMRQLLRKILKDTWRAEKQRKRGDA